jgi:ribonuclease E
MGGVVCCDFIDMRSESHKRKVERRLIGLLKKHKERAKVLRMSEFGIIELTRQRQRSSFSRNFFQDCPHCRGSGLVKTIESVVIDVIRMIQYAATRDTVTQIEVTLNPEVATLLQNRKRSIINELERSQRRAITIRPNPSFGPDQIDVQCYDQRARIVPFS